MPSRADMRKRNGYKYESRWYLKAIVQDIEAGERKGRKYHDIRDNPTTREAFEVMVKQKFPNAFMVIYYNNDRSEHSRVKLK